LHDIYAKKALISKLESEVEDLYALLDLNEPTVLVEDGLVLEVTENWRFDPETARKNLTRKQVLDISVAKPDSRLAKKTLSEDDYLKAQKYVGLRRTIKPITDEED